MIDTRASDGLPGVSAVALHLVGARMASGRSRLVDVGAIWVDSQGQLRRFSSLVGGGDLFDPLAERLGLDPLESAAAPGEEEVLGALLRELPDPCILVVHGAALSRSVLRGLSRARLDRRLLDTLTLSGIVCPSFTSHGMTDLCMALGVAAPADRRALSHAESIRQLYGALLQRAAGLPPPLLRELAALLSPLRGDPLGRVFRGLAGRGRGREPQAYASLFREETFPRRRRAADSPVVLELRVPEVESVFASGGGLSRVVTHYESRDEQVTMTGAVARAFNTARFLVAEAGTGVGKSLAYAVPAVLWALVNETPVVLSTNTKNLQRQLFEKDLPLVGRALETTFRSALLKGRGNYLCVRRLLYLLRHADSELERDERAPLASVMVWGLETKSGDLGESLIGDRPHLQHLAGKLMSVAEECPGKECAYYRRCFLQRARRLALAADIVVANHAVVLAEIGNTRDSAVLPPHRQIVFDEAHNLEDAATSAFTRDISASRIGAILGRIRRAGTRRRQRGLMPALLADLQRCNDAAARAGEGAAVAAVIGLGEAVCATVHAAQDAVLPFFHALARCLGKESVQARRLLPGGRAGAVWHAVETARTELIQGLVRVREDLGEFLESAAALDEEPGQIVGEFSRELAAALLWMREFIDDVGLVIDGGDPTMVCWVERRPPAQGDACAKAAPVSVANLLFESLYSQRDSVVFTSATLAVGGNTDFLKGRLGIDLVAPERVDQLLLGTAFDFARQCMLLVPVFLPDPGNSDAEYVRDLAPFLGALSRTMGGRLMALFTSHRMLRESGRLLQGEMQGADIRVLVQGVSGTRDRITRQFRTGERSVLLGTQSFWEGVDVVGDALSVLVITRLPFPVHTDPIVAARCEALEQQGVGSFSGYSLPQAVIRFRQGFGRLIRHREDRGVVIVSDRRLLTRAYGEVFSHSLPLAPRAVADAASLLRLVGEFFAAGPSAEPG